MSKFLVSAAVVSAVILGSSVAMAGSGLARGAAVHNEIEHTEGDDGYGYKFDDDLLAADGVGTDAVMIRVRQGAVRRMLIRPRTHFVPELLKSIELI